MTRMRVLLGLALVGLVGGVALVVAGAQGPTHSTTTACPPGGVVHCVAPHPVQSAVTSPAVLVGAVLILAAVATAVGVGIVALRGRGESTRV